MTISTDNSEFIDLADKKHYLGTMEFTVSEMLSTFDTLTCNYLSLIEEHYKKHNKEFGNYILIKGHNMLCSVFELTLLYTNNLLVTCSTVQRSVLLFCEFVSQIHHDKYNYLHLSIRDAVLFVYKKTIYRLDNSHSSLSSTNQGKHRHRLLDQHHSLISIYLKTFIDSYCEKCNECLSALVGRLQKLDKKLLSVSFHLEKEDTLYEVIYTVHELFNVMNRRNHIDNQDTNKFMINYDATIRILGYLKTCISKKHNLIDVVFRIQNKLYSADFLHLLETEQTDSALKYLIKS